MTSAMRAQESPQSRISSLMRLVAGSIESRLAALVALVALILILWPLNGLERDYDEGVYWQSLRAMAGGHPLFTSVFSSQPPFFLVSLYPFYRLFGQSIAAARFGIAVFAIIGIVAIYWLGRMLGGHWVGLAAAALLAFDPTFLQEARTLQAEAPALALEILAVALAVAATQRPARRARLALELACGFTLALGLLIKLLDVVAVVPIILYLAHPLWATFDAGDGQLRLPARATARPALLASVAPLGWVALGGIIGCVVVLAPFAGSFGALWDQVVRFHLVAAKVEPVNLPANLATIAGGMKTLGIPALLTLGLAAWQRVWRVLPPLLWLGASLVMLARQSPLFDHHIALVTPCLALITAMALTLPPLPIALRQFQTLGIGVILAVCVLYGIVNGGATARSLTAAPSEATVRAVSAIATFTAANQPVVGDEQYLLALANRDTPPELVDTSHVRIATRYLTAAQLERILERPDTRFVVLSSGRLQTVPEFIPWLNANYRKIVDLGDGSAIYERAPSNTPIV